MQPPQHIAHKTAAFEVRNVVGEPHGATESLPPENDQSHLEAQSGVQEVEAITLVWSRTTITIIYILIWIGYFVLLLDQAASGALLAYVTSAFQQHSLTPTVSILSSIISAVSNLTVAKILDVYGRSKGYAMSLVLATLGLAMMAATTTVEMYAAAQVFWAVGNNALGYILGILVADTTSLRNRGLLLAVTSTPSIITTWLGGPVAEAFLYGPGWQWCYGMFAIILPVLCAPLAFVLAANSRKAKKQGVLRQKQESRSLREKIIYPFREFDAVGLLLISAGLAILLLPFDLYGLQPLGWKSPLIICLLVFGVVLMVAFAVWEKHASVTFLPYDLLLDRDLIGACILGATLFFSYYCWASYFSSFLQVVNGLSVTTASYVSQINGVLGVIGSIITGVAIRYTGDYKLATHYVGIPVYTLFTGLLIYFRQPDMHVGYIIMCQVMMALSSGIITVTPTIAAMSRIDHQNIAVVVATIGMFSSIGGAVGLTVAGAIWQAVFPAKLAQYLPAEDQEFLLDIYGSLDVQLSYPVGTPARAAIQQAYGDAQALMLTAGTAVWILGFIGTAMWRNTNVRDVKNMRGQVI